MSGVFKAIASVASIVAMIPGPWQPIAAAVAVTASIGAAVTAKKPVSERQGIQLQFKIDPGAPIPYLIGRTATGGTVVHRDTYGTKNHYYSYIVILSGGGPVNAIEAFTADRTVVPLSGTSATGYYANWMWSDRQLGATPEADALTGGVSSPPYGTAGPIPSWGSAYKLSGYAAVSWTMLFDTKARRYQNGEPVPGWVVQGCKVYDPRLDSTYPGGSGACRWADPSDKAAHAAARLTWLYSETPALHGLMWRLGIWQRNETNPAAEYRKVMGIGAPIDLIDIATIVQSANVQEANGWKVGGELNSGMDRYTALKLIEEAGGAEPVANGARLSTMQKAERVSLATITANDLADGATLIPGMRPRVERINGYRARFRSEAHGWEMTDIELVQVPAYVTADKGEKTGSGDFPLVQIANQAAALAAYQVFDSRELLPITLALKPKWIAYRIGDCLTVDIPEYGFNGQDILVRGRRIDPMTGVVTLTVATETAAKHAAALSKTGVTPPIPTLTVDTGDVEAPEAGEWSATGATFTDNGVSFPAIVAVGNVDNTNADAVVFEYRVYDVGNGDDDNWLAAGIEAPNHDAADLSQPATARKEITSVTPGTQYEIGVRYRVRGVVGERLILGPVTAGNFGTTAALQLAVATSFPIGTSPSVTDDGTLTISDHVRRYTDGHADVAVDGDVIATGLSPGDFRAIGYDDFNRVGGAVTYQLFANDIDARASPDHPGRHYVGYFFVVTAGSPPGGGGGASPPGGNCVTIDTPIMMADRTTKPAGDIVVGDLVLTRHEAGITSTGGGWGIYPVEAIEIVDSEDVWEATIAGRALRATGDHLVYTGTWVKMRDIGTLVGAGQVVKMTVTGAHTYVSNGVLSHNIKQNELSGA